MGKQVDKNDFWFIEKNPITKVGVYPYLGKQISQDCEPDKIYYVLRPKEELFRKETLDSLRLIPLIDGHTMIGKDFTAPEDKGLDGTLGDNVSHDTDTIYNDLKIISNKMKEEIKNGKKELSLGYFCRYDKQPGTYKGQRYDYVQRDIIANHLALVDKGRMGADVRVYDSQNIPEGEAFAMDSIDMEFAEDKDKVKEWFTSRGNHIPILEGQTKEQAFKAFIEKRQKEKETNPELNLNDDPVLNEPKPETKKEEKRKDLYTKKENIYDALSRIPYNRARSYQWYERKNYENADIKVGNKKENMRVLYAGNSVNFFPRVTVNGSEHTDIEFGLGNQKLTQIDFTVGGGGYLYSIKFKDGTSQNNGHIDTADKKTLRKWGISDEMIDGFREHILSRYPTLKKDEKEKIIASLKAIDEKKSAIYEKANRKEERRKQIFEAKKKLNDITNEYKQKLEDVISEGKRKGIVTRYKGLEITKNGDFNEDIEVSREYRHPDEYSDNGIDYEERFQKWQRKLYDIRDKYKNKYLKEKEKVDNHPVAKKFNQRFEEYKNNKDYTMKTYGWTSGTEHQFQDKKGNGVISFYPDTFTIKKKIKDSEGDFWVEDSFDDIEEYQTTGGDMALDDEDIEWITVRGTHVPIKKGATAEQKTKTIENFFKMKRVNNKEDVDIFENEEKRKKFEELNAELHGKNKAEPEKKGFVNNKGKEQSWRELKPAQKEYFHNQTMKGIIKEAENDKYFEDYKDLAAFKKYVNGDFNEILHDMEEEKGDVVDLNEAYEEAVGSFFKRKKSGSSKAEPEKSEWDKERDKENERHEKLMKKLKKEIEEATDPQEIRDLREHRNGMIKEHNRRLDQIFEDEEKSQKAGNSEPEQAGKISQKEKELYQNIVRKWKQNKTPENEKIMTEAKMHLMKNRGISAHEIAEMGKEVFWEDKGEDSKDINTEKGMKINVNGKIKNIKIEMGINNNEPVGCTYEILETIEKGRDDDGNFIVEEEDYKKLEELEKELKKNNKFSFHLNTGSLNEICRKVKEANREYKTIQGEGKMADKKEKVAIDEDKRKVIDEIGGILKDAGLDDELIRTVIGKAEKIAYNKSEAGDDGEEVEEEFIDEEENVNKKPAKDKCGKDDDEEEADKEEEEKKKVVKAFAQKEKLGKEVEDALGTFDHSEMTELEIAKYACDKLDLEVEKGQEISAVKGYLKGLAKAPKATFGYKTVAADSGIQTTDAEFEKFVNKGE